jgi:hypothetical protein
LADELVGLLLCHKIIEGDEAARVRADEEYIMVFALSMMHLAKVLIDEKQTAELHLDVSSLPPDRLVINMRFSVPTFPRVMSTIFESNCLIKDWCHPSLIPEPAEDDVPLRGIPDWSVPLELDRGGRLVPFGQIIT